MNDSLLYEYAEFLKSKAELVLLTHPYTAALRDSNDLNVIQTAEQGLADAICTNDKDFRDSTFLCYCESKRIRIFNEKEMLGCLFGETRH